MINCPYISTHSTFKLYMPSELKFNMLCFHKRHNLGFTWCGLCQVQNHIIYQTFPVVLQHSISYFTIRFLARVHELQPELELKVSSQIQRTRNLSVETQIHTITRWRNTRKTFLRWGGGTQCYVRHILS